MYSHVTCIDLIRDPSTIISLSNYFIEQGITYRKLVHPSSALASDRGSKRGNKRGNDAQRPVGLITTISIN